MIGLLFAMSNKGEYFYNLRFLGMFDQNGGSVFCFVVGFLFKAFSFLFKTFLVWFLKLFVCFLKLFGGCLIKTAAAVQEIRNHLHPQFVQLHKMIKRNFIPMCTFREGQNKEMAATWSNSTESMLQKKH